MAFVEGFLIGLTTVIFFGPVFFTILNATLQYGYKGGLVVTGGIVTSDLCCVLICLQAAPFVERASSKIALALVGGAVLLVMGIKYLVKPIQYQQKDLKLHAGHYAGFFSKGFLVNFTSPFTFIYWLGSSTYGIKFFPENFDLFGFVASILAGILLIDIVKVFLSRQLKKLLQPKYLRLISMGCGIVLILFALRMGWYIYTIWQV